MYPNGAKFCLSLTYDVEMCTNFPVLDVRVGPSQRRNRCG